MKNPYDVLGVSNNASLDEVKEAYKALAKEYYESSDEYSQSKLRELDEAYDAIINNRSGYSHNQTDIFKEIRLNIRNGNIVKAEELLNSFPSADRNAEWYFLSGNVNSKKGYFENAANDFTTAYNMEPDNAEYRAAYDNFNRRRSANYRTTDPTQNIGCTVCNICQALICADCLCSCCNCCG